MDRGSAESGSSAVAGGAIIAGAIGNAALTLLLLAFGGAVGFSSVSPWSGSGVSAGTFKITTGIYLVVVAMLASTIGGYLAGRLRTRWTGLDRQEILFRDTAHGFLSWALAGVIGASLLSGAATYMVGGVAAGAAQGGTQAATRAAQSTAATGDYFVDRLLRPAASGAAAPAGAADPAAGRGEVAVVLSRALTRDEGMPASDRAYLAQVVAARTGLSPADADKRISQVVAQAKAAADEARRAAAALSIWLTISMLVGAFSASLAAIEGGQLRDGTWKGVIGARNYRERTT